MKNNRHKELYKGLQEMRKSLKLLVCQSISLKLGINQLGRTEERLAKIQRRKNYRREITKVNQEIRNLKLDRYTRVSEEFWVVGIIKDGHKKVRDNLWVLTFRGKHMFERISNPTIDLAYMTFKYDSPVKAISAVGSLNTEERFRGKYKFVVLHFKNGRFLDDLFS